MSVALTDLEDALRIAPVMGQFHPLTPIALAQEVDIISAPEKLVEELDALAPHVERPILVSRLKARFKSRFLVLSYAACPPAEAINQYLSHRVELAQKSLITSHTIADQIIADIREKQYKTVMLLLVDGLSYADVIDWPEHPQPCFIDGPSITFSRMPDGQIDPKVGFPSIIGTPPLSRRLIDYGLPHSRGFSYWERAQNDVSEKLFAGVPLQKVNGLVESFDELEKLNLNGFYIQMVREGLDGLAHGRREVSQSEIEATVKAIHQDFRYLIELATKKEVRGAIYLVADHGLLWKNQHNWQTIGTGSTRRPRYTVDNPNQPEYTTHFSTELQEFYLWHYPYLGRAIRANDSGVHGGLSYWESIVPFIRVEVNI